MSNKKLSLFIAVAISAQLITGCGNNNIISPNASNSDDNIDVKDQNEKEAAKVGDILDAPEKIADIDAYDELTIKTKVENDEVFPSHYIFVKRQENIRICGADFIYYNQGQTRPIEFSYEYNGIVEGNSIFQLNNYGFDIEVPDYVGYSYGPSAVNGYKKLEDAKIGDVDCYVYETEHDYGDGIIYNVRIHVSKETGIWMKQEILDEDYPYVETVTSIEYNTDEMPYVLWPSTVTPGVIWEQAGVKVCVEELDWYGGHLRLTAENSNTYAVKLASTLFEINDICLGQEVFDEPIPEGEKLSIDIALPERGLQLCGIDVIKDINLRFCLESAHYVNDEDYYPYYETDEIIIDESEDVIIVTDCDESYVQEISDDSEVLFEGSGIKVQFVGCIEDDGYDPILLYYVENGFSEKIRARVYVHKVNGIEVDDSSRAQMPSGCKGYFSMDFSTSELEKFGQIKTVELGYGIYYGDMDERGSLSGETITLAESGDNTITIYIER